MKNRFSGFVAVVFASLALVGLAFAQAGNASEMAVLAICRASGVPAASRTTADRCLQYLQSIGGISSKTVVTITNAMKNDKLTNSDFAIFVADVVNGATEAPKNAKDAADHLAKKGIVVPTGAGKPDGETLAGVTTGVVLEVNLGYKAALSGISR